METFRIFNTTQEARDYRYENHTGGWIFEQEKGGLVVLCPAEYSPACIFRHPFTRGMVGRLIGNT